MEFRREEALRAESAQFVGTEKIAPHRLVIHFGHSPFFDAAAYADGLKHKLEKQRGSSVGVEIYSSPIDSLPAFRKLVRAIPKFDAIELIHDGTESFVKNLVPAVLIARFYGKEISLHYYPPDYPDRIPYLHRKVLPLFSRVWAGSHFEQRQLFSFGIKSEVKYPPLNFEAFPVRTITEIQPHILVAHENPGDAGGVSAISAFKMVKEKYPRAVLTVITSDKSPWQTAIENKIHSSQCDYYCEPFNLIELKKVFSEADVFLNVSPSETVSPALLTAMASGMTTISFESYGAREIIESGVNGFLVRHNEPGQIADRIIQLIEEPALVSRISQEAIRIRTKPAV